MGATVTYLSGIFNTSTRWAFLLLLVVIVLLKGRLAFFARGHVGLILFAYLLWCSATYLWSQVPLLSALKVTALLMLVVGFVSSGYMWVRWTGVSGAIWYAFPLVFIALFAALVGTVTPTSRLQSAGVELYTGLAGNPNMLGSLLDMTLPFLLVQMYRSRPRPRAWLAWTMILGVVVIFLLMTVSRASILAALAIGVGYILTARTLRPIHVTFLAGITIVVSIVVIIGASEQLVARYVYKGQQYTEYGVLQTRMDPWTISYEAAKEGGLIGAGYGVSVGYTEFRGGLTAVGYGREKGNTQLAIIEETGLVGFVLYATFLFALSKKIRRTMRRCDKREDRVLLGTLAGGLTGYFIKSIFEAWWVAPGSPEAAYFWATAGVVLGICAMLDAKLQRHGR